MIGRVLLGKIHSLSYTVKHIDSISSEFAIQPEIIKIARKYQTPQQVYEYVYNSAAYVPDESDGQQIRTPIATLRDESANCVDYTTLLSAILKAQGVEHYYRVVAYDNHNEWQHIYIVLPDGTAIDCVHGQRQDGTDTLHNRDAANYYGYELRYKTKKDYKAMNLYRLNGQRNYRLGLTPRVVTNFVPGQVQHDEMPTVQTNTQYFELPKSNQVPGVSNIPGSQYELPITQQPTNNTQHDPPLPPSEDNLLTQKKGGVPIWLWLVGAFLTYKALS